MKPKCKKVTKYWLEYYVDKKTGLCSLCGNMGIVDTTLSVISPLGLKTGSKNFCICPNGQAMRNAKVEL